jgi:hypothetical protein
MLLDESWLVFHNAAQHERDKDRVIKLSSDWNEIGDQVERHSQVRDQGSYEELAASREPLVAHQPREQDHAVRDEPARFEGSLD